MSRSSPRQVVVQCCRVGLQEGGESLPGDVDWGEALSHALAEGVVSTFYQALSDPSFQGDPSVLVRAREALLGQSLAAMQLAPRFVEVVALLNSEGIRVLAYKGLAVAQQMYGTLVARPTGDIDILVDPRDAWLATKALRAAGYIPTPIHWSDSQQRAHIKYGEGRAFHHLGTKTDVDLHWTAFDRWIDLPLQFDDLWERREELVWPGGVLPTLGRNDSALMLCLHGCQHGFERLKWAVDVAKAMAPDSGVNWDIVARTAGHRAPMVEYALRYVSHLFGAVPPGRARFARVVPMAQSAADRYVANLSPGPGGVLDPVIARNVDPRLSARGLSALYHYLRAWLRPTNEDVDTLDLPFLLHRFYCVLRVWRLGQKCWLRRVWRSGSGSVVSLWEGEV